MHWLMIGMVAVKAAEQGLGTLRVMFGGQWHEGMERLGYAKNRLEAGEDPREVRLVRPVRAAIEKACRVAEEMKARARAATPPPWVRDEAPDGEQLPDGSGSFDGYYQTNNVIRPQTSECDLAQDVANCFNAHDADFIAAARTDVPEAAATMLDLAARLERTTRALLALTSAVLLSADDDDETDMRGAMNEAIDVLSDADLLDDDGPTPDGEALLMMPRIYEDSEGRRWRETKRTASAIWVVSEDEARDEGMVTPKGLCEFRRVQ